jgi:hypothetical protein
VDGACRENWLLCWSGKNCAGKNTSQLNLLILGSLRYLEGDLASMSVKSAWLSWKRSATTSFINSLKWEVLKTANEAKSHLPEFKMVDKEGIVSLADAIYIVHEKCTYQLSRLHKGGKSKQTTRTFNLSASHRYHIIAITKGHPG